MHMKNACCLLYFISFEMNTAIQYIAMHQSRQFDVYGCACACICVCPLYGMSSPLARFSDKLKLKCVLYSAFTFMLCPVYFEWSLSVCLATVAGWLVGWRALSIPWHPPCCRLPQVPSDVPPHSHGTSLDYSEYIFCSANSILAQDQLQQKSIEKILNSPLKVLN